MDWVLIVTISAVIKVVTVSIIIDLEINWWVIANCVIVVRWPVVDVQHGIGLPAWIVLVIVVYWTRVCGISVHSVGGSIAWSGAGAGTSCPSGWWSWTWWSRAWWTRAWWSSSQFS